MKLRLTSCWYPLLISWITCGLLPLILEVSVTGYGLASTGAGSSRHGIMARWLK